MVPPEVPRKAPLVAHRDPRYAALVILSPPPPFARTVADLVQPHRAFLLFLFVALTALAILTTAEGVYLRLQRAQPLDLELLAAGRMADWYTCGILILGLYWLTRTFPITRRNWPVAGALQGAAIGAAAALKFVLYVPLRRALDPGLGGSLSEAIAHGFFGKLLFFFAVSAVLHAFHYYGQAQRPPPGADDLLGLTRKGSPQLAITSGGGTHWLDMAQIDWVEAQGNYARIHVAGQRYLVPRTMRSLATELGPDFIRVHRGAIVNRHRITARQMTAHGGQRLELSDGSLVPVSRSTSREIARQFG